jgi:hypothetical protein
MENSLIMNKNNIIEVSTWVEAQEAFAKMKMEIFDSRKLMDFKLVKNSLKVHRYNFYYDATIISSEPSQAEIDHIFFSEESPYNLFNITMSKEVYNEFHFYIIVPKVKGKQLSDSDDKSRIAFHDAVINLRKNVFTLSSFKQQLRIGSLVESLCSELDKISYSSLPHIIIPKFHKVCQTVHSNLPKHNRCIISYCHKLTMDKLILTPKKKNSEIFFVNTDYESLQKRHQEDINRKMLFKKTLKESEDEVDRLAITLIADSINKNN